jgi:hypothetical protein
MISSNYQEQVKSVGDDLLELKAAAEHFARFLLEFVAKESLSSAGRARVLAVLNNVRAELNAASSGWLEKYQYEIQNFVMKEREIVRLRHRTR